MNDIPKAVVNALEEFASQFSNLRQEKASIDIAKVAVRNLLKKLEIESKKFSPESFIQELEKYLNNNGRLLYSEITIYVNDLSSENDEKLTTLMSNLDKLYEFQSNNVLSEDQKLNEKLKKTIVKLWDHVSLANVQIERLKMSDEEFERKINPTVIKIENYNTNLETTREKLVSEINDAKSEIEENKKEIYTQLISIVGVFVAIAFVMFGGMSLLNNLFDYSSLQRVPLLEMLCGGSLIGLVILYAIYAFIMFILKITGHVIDSDKNLLYENIVKKLRCVLVFILVITGFLWFMNWNSINDTPLKTDKTECRVTNYNKQTNEVTLVCPAENKK